MLLKFSTPCAFENDVLVASFGFTGAMDPTAAERRVFAEDLNGVLLTGSYDEILASVPAGAYQAGIVFLGNCGKEDAFIKKLSQTANCALTGGAAAINPATGESGLILGRGQAAVFLVQDDRYDVSVVSENIHGKIGECCVEMQTPRKFASIDGQNPIDWYNARRKEFSLAENDFEHFTLSDSLGVNAHLSIVDGELVSGRDLEEQMHLRYIAPDAVDAKIHAFYDDVTALVCGCAGLKGILTKPLDTNGTGLFLFGEVCSVDGISRFGNLMLSKLCVKKR